LLEAGVLTEPLDAQYNEQIMAEVNQAQQTAELAPYPEVEWGAGPVYAA
jgi:TPP-dependent pyruvate/acetoin dehydrogenase alpha subunit